MKQLIKKTLLVIMLVLPMVGLAVSSTPIRLQKPDINVHDKASLERGAKFFATNCMVCHSMKYLQFDPVAKSAGVTLDKMPKQDQDWWFGTAPPDLTLVARVRGAAWLYTYLHSFYKDTNREIGSNNLLMNNSSMPNPFLGLQGEQVLVVNKKALMNHELDTTPEWFNVLKLQKPGSVPVAQFNANLTDLVNFLVYAAEPAKIKRESLGWYVLGFLVLLLLVAFLLKKEYWKDVK